MKSSSVFRLFIPAALAVIVLAVLTACPPANETSTTSVTVDIPPPPVTEKEDVVDTIHGVEVADPYRWLEAKDAPETREWIDAQNAYTDEILQQIPGRDELEELFTRLIKIDTISTPQESGGRYFYTRRGAEQDLSIIYMREGLDGEEQVLIDPHTMSEDNSISASITDINTDGTRMIYSIRTGGVDEVEMRILDINSGEDLDFVLPVSRYYNAQFSPDSSYIIYTAYTDEGPRTYKHVMGTSRDDDTEIFGEGYGPEKIIFVQISPNGNWHLATVMHGSAGGTSLFIQPAAGGDWMTVIADGESNSFGQFADDTLLINTNKNAPNGTFMKVDAANPSMENWEVVIPEDSEMVLQGATALGGHVVGNFLEDVKSKAIVYNLDGDVVRDIELPAIGSLGGFSGHWDSNEVFYSYSSLHIPTTIYRYDMGSGEQTEWASIEVPIDSDSMELKQEWFESKDGTRVPMFILHKKGIELDGENPTLLYGYGGFNVNATPRFTSRVAWVEMGGIYVVANIRGGGEFGEAWHRAGMLGNKQNVFDDFIAAGEYLIERKYTSSEHLGIVGGSNGGLLVGAMMTQRPELWGAVVCTYPLLDMVRYHQFLVASFWVPEYGSSEDPAQFAYIYEYSPYHNVEEGTEYPPTLFITGDGDSRVAPLHARKMAAMVQANNGGDAPIMLRYHTKAGHSGGQPASEQIANSVDTYSFLKWQLFPK